MSATIDLDRLTLQSGSHDDRDEGVCLMEAVAWWAGEPHSDQPGCTCPVLGAFARRWNDGMRSDEERAQLIPYVPVLAGTVDSGEAAARRVWMALDWTVRVSAPAWLDLAGLGDCAARLRALPEQTGPDDATLALLLEAQDAARDAARVAGWDAAALAC